MLKKKKISFFGNNIMPSCSYCTYGSSCFGGECSLHYCIDEEGKCAKFRYEPLKRVPKEEFDIKMFDYKFEDFKI